MNMTQNRCKTGAPTMKCHLDQKKKAEQLYADVQPQNGPVAVVARGSVGRMAEKTAGAAGAEQNGRT